MIRKTTKGPGANYRPTKSGAGMTAKGVAAIEELILDQIKNSCNR